MIPLDTPMIRHLMDEIEKGGIIVAPCSAGKTQAALRMVYQYPTVYLLLVNYEKTRMLLEQHSSWLIPNMLISSLDGMECATKKGWKVIVDDAERIYDGYTHYPAHAMLVSATRSISLVKNTMQTVRIEPATLYCEENETPAQKNKREFEQALQTHASVVYDNPETVQREGYMNGELMVVTSADLIARHPSSFSSPWVPGKLVTAGVRKGGK